MDSSINHRDCSTYRTASGFRTGHIYICILHTYMYILITIPEFLAVSHHCITRLRVPKSPIISNYRCVTWVTIRSQDRSCKKRHGTTDDTGTLLLCRLLAAPVELPELVYVGTHLPSTRVPTLHVTLFSHCLLELIQTSPATTNPCHMLFHLLVGSLHTIWNVIFYLPLTFEQSASYLPQVPALQSFAAHAL